MRLHLVRHAQTMFNVRHVVQGWCDSPLTPHGEKQVEALGNWFRDVDVSAAYTSDLTRTRTTAEGALTGHPGLEAIPMQELREWYFGGWEGRHNGEMWQAVAEVFGAGDADVSGETAENHIWEHVDRVIDAVALTDPEGIAETSGQVAGRAAWVMEHLGASHPTGDVVLVTHGAFLLSLLNVALSEIPGGPPIVENCAIVTLEGEPGKLTFAGVDVSCSLLG